MLTPLFGFSLAAVAVTQPLPAEIRVKVFPHLYNYPPQGRDAHPSYVRLVSDSNCTIYLGDSDSPTSTGKVQSQVDSLDVTLTGNGLANPLWIECDDPITVMRAGAAVQYSYSGPLYAHQVSSGPEIIETQPMNEYLKGVVPSEMPYTWPKEALKAQAIAARSYAYFHMLANQMTALNSNFYDVDDTVLYQAYTGINAQKTETNQAIDETGSTVILYQGGVIQAYFSADAGGYTEDASHVWQVQFPYCKAKPEPFQDPGYDGGKWGPWNVSFSLQEINQRLQGAGLIPTSNPAVALAVTDQDRYESGRARVVTATLADRREVQLDAQQFRRELGLKSTLFSLESKSDDSSDQVLIHGRGFGHGVGLSQYGARVLAQQQGWDAVKILNFYYTDVQLTDPKTGSGTDQPSTNPPQN